MLHVMLQFEDAVCRVLWENVKSIASACILQGYMLSLRGASGKTEKDSDHGQRSAKVAMRKTTMVNNGWG